ncbi:hypothetical protein M3Y96_00298000 [Aphelenchoides besseyi]|nr:hypothetical protein M3Y96_00298000 [Aphelenchoides besseyi]
MIPSNETVIIVNAFIEVYALFYVPYIYTMTVINTIVVVMMMRFILRHLPKIDPGKRCLLAAMIIKGWTLQIVFAFWQPAILPPFFGGYCLGLFKYVPFGFLLGGWLTFATMEELALILFISFLVQSFRLNVFAARRTAPILDWFSINAFKLTPAQYSAMNLDSLRIKHPSTLLMPMHNRIEVGFVAAFVFTVIVLSVCFSVFVNWAFYRAIKKTSDVVQPRTFEMQKAVQRILSDQLFTAIFFYYLPMAIISVNIFMYQKSNYDKGFFISQLSMLLFPLYLPSQWIISFIRFPQFRLMLKSWVRPKDSTQRNSLT